MSLCMDSSCASIGEAREPTTVELYYVLETLNHLDILIWRNSSERTRKMRFRGVEAQVHGQQQVSDRESATSSQGESEMKQR